MHIRQVLPLEEEIWVSWIPVEIKGKVGGEHTVHSVHSRASGGICMPAGQDRSSVLYRDSIDTRPSTRRQYEFITQQLGKSIEQSVSLET